MSKITLYESATPAAAPPAGTVYLYPKVDGRWYWMDDTGTEYPMRPIGTGAGDLLSDGTVPLTANWDAGSFKITAQQLESDVPTGTAPLVVASQTVVPNLNASLLGGNSAAAFGTAAQGALADTAIQPADINTLAGLNTVVADATILATSDIGSDVQAWSTVLDNTTASFTTADETKLDGIDPIASVQSNLAATVAPTATDDTNAGYAVGSSWRDTTNDEVYLCIDATAAAAVWKQVGSGTGGGVNAVFKTGAYTAAPGDIVGVGSDTAAITITLPLTPAADSYVGIWDADDNAGVNNITVARNGETIDGAAADFIINVSGGRVDLIYNGTTWKVAYTTPGAAGFSGIETWRFHAYDFSQVSGETTRVQSGPVSQFDALTMADTGFNWAATPIIMPKRWDGGQFRFRVVWTPTTANTGDIVIGLFGDKAADGAVFPAIGSTGPTVVDTAQGTADRIHISGWSSWASFAGPPVANELIQLRIQRNGDSGSDTHTGTIELIMVEVQWHSNAPTDD